MEQIVLTKSELMDVFDLWRRDFMENPDEFDTAESRVNYGEDGSKYFLDLLERVRKNN